MKHLDRVVRDQREVEGLAGQLLLGYVMPGSSESGGSSQPHSLIQGRDNRAVVGKGHPFLTLTLTIKQ